VTGIILERDGYIAEIHLWRRRPRSSRGCSQCVGDAAFAGRSIDDLEQAFADTIADYEEWCRERGKEPERPYSGKLPLRIAPELHRALAMAAKAGKSINSYVSELIEKDTARAAWIIGERQTAALGAPARRLEATQFNPSLESQKNAC
jgi:predicted HicB family RNase H-like nuclease